MGRTVPLSIVLVREGCGDVATAWVCGQVAMLTGAFLPQNKHKPYMNTDVLTIISSFGDIEA
jgi:hypothetical protein